MTLANGRHYLAIPGPSVAPDEVLQAMHRAAPNIYEGELIDMVPGIATDLKKVARTTGQVAIYISNGHGVWEAALVNTHNPGDRALVLATGRFGHGWAQIGESLGITCDIVEFGRSAPVDIAKVEHALRADKDKAYTSVLVTHVDTSSSARNDLLAVRRLLDELDHPALLMADCMASLGCDPFEMDAWGVDVTIAGCQKGLMTPPGMGYVFFNDRAEVARERIQRISPYWDWKPRCRPDGFWQYWFGTAPTHHLYGQRVALDMILAEGIENVWARHDKLARAIWAAVDAWGANGPMTLNITDPNARSTAVTSVTIGKPYGTQLRNWVTENAGITLGIGLGMETEDDPKSEGFFRIGHMGHVNSHMVLGVLGSVEAGLRALEIPFGSGALEAAARICSET